MSPAELHEYDDAVQTVRECARALLRMPVVGVDERHQLATSLIQVATRLVRLRPSEAT